MYLKVFEYYRNELTETSFSNWVCGPRNFFPHNSTAAEGRWPSWAWGAEVGLGGQQRKWGLSGDPSQLTV